MGSVVEHQRYSGKLRDWGIYIHSAIDFRGDGMGIENFQPASYESCQDPFRYQPASYESGTAFHYQYRRRRAVRVPRC